MAKYNDLKDFIQDNILKYLKEPLQRHINCENHINEQSDKFCAIENMKVGALSCFNLHGDEFNMDIGVSCIVRLVDKGTGWDIGTGRRKWYTIHTHDRLDDTLTIEVRGVEKYKKNQPMKEKACSQFLLPYINNAKMEDIADKFVTEVYKDYDPKDRYRLPHKAIEEKFNLKVYAAEMPENF